jgi:hypothetical protein
MNASLTEQLANIRTQVPGGSYSNRIDDIIDTHKRNQQVFQEYDEISSKIVGTIHDYLDELQKSPLERKREKIVMALTLPHDLVFETIRKIVDGTPEMLGKRIELFSKLTFVFEDLRFILRDMVADANGNGKELASYLGIYQQALITSRDTHSRLVKVNEAIN